MSGARVWGIESDFNADLNGTHGSAVCGTTCHFNGTWPTTVRGRVGYAFDRWLPYFTGGAAFGKVEASSTNPAAAGASDIRTGSAVGAGIEYAFLGNWSSKFEYLYVDLGSFDCNAACSGAAATLSSVDYKTNGVRAGLNYKFSGPIFSRY